MVLLAAQSAFRATQQDQFTDLKRDKSEIREGAESPGPLQTLAHVW